MADLADDGQTAEVLVEDVLRELGGVARRAALLHVVERADLERALAAGLVVRDARGVYCLPQLDEATRAAARLGGVISHVSAALSRRWPVAVVPPEPEVIVSRGRRLPRTRGAHVRFAELAAADVDGVATSAARTLLDCLRTLPYDQALAVADSALREEGCRQLLTAVADTAAGPGSRQVRLVAARADARAANPFESTLRALCHQVEGLAVEPQVEISDDGHYACVDLADRRLRIVCEADSFEWHGGRQALADDAERYNELVVQGWLVLRFSYEQVMNHPHDVLRTLRRAVALAEVLNERGSSGPAAA